MALQRVGHDWATNTLTFHFFIVNFAYLWNWLLEFGHSLGHGKPCFTPQFNLNLLKITYSFIELPLKRYHIPVLVCLCAKSLQSCLTPCNPMNCSLPVSVHVILQARILEWVVMLFSKGSSQPRDQTCISWIGRVFFFFPTTSTIWKVPIMCPSLCQSLKFQPLPDHWNVDSYLERHCGKCNENMGKTQTRQKGRNQPPRSNSAFLAPLAPELSLHRCMEFSDGQWRKALSEQMPSGFVE